ncbi:MAG TPA: glycosyltransferase family 39 protein [Elusimicrobiota bacterium]|nr:glycosyltransferase family 39 protein [Elusimicrobiota bacterium]
MEQQPFGVRWRGRLELLAVGGCLIVYFLLACYKFDSPAVLLDTFSVTSEFFDSAHLARPSETVPYSPREIYPLYHGKLAVYLLWPVFLTFGASHTVMQGWTILTGALMVLLTWLFVRKILGSGHALLTVFLLVIHTPFVVGVKTGNYTHTYMLCFSVGALLSLAHWWDTRLRRWLALAMFLLGVGLGSRFWFVWIVGAVFASGGIFYPVIKRRFQVWDGRARLKLLSWAVIPFLIGLSPILRHEYVTNGESVLRLLRNYPSPTNFSRVSGWIEVIQAINAFLTGSGYYDFADLDGIMTLGDVFYPVIVWGGVLWLLLFIKGEKNDFAPRGVAILFVVMCGEMVLTNYTRIFEMITFYPLPQIIIASFLLDLASRVQKTRWKRFIVAGLSMLLVMGEVRSVSAYLVCVRTVGFCGGRFADSFRDVSEWFRRPLGAAGIPVLATDELKPGFYFRPPHMELMPSLYPSPAWDHPPIRYEQDPWRTDLSHMDDYVKRHGIKKIYYVRLMTPDYSDSTADLLMTWSSLRDRSMKLKRVFHDGDGSPRFQLYLLDVTLPKDRNSSQEVRLVEPPAPPR